MKSQKYYKQAGAELGQAQSKIGQLGKLMSSSSETFFMSFSKVVFLRCHLPVRLNSCDVSLKAFFLSLCKVLFLYGCLTSRSSSCDVLFLVVCLPVRYFSSLFTNIFFLISDDPHQTNFEPNCRSGASGGNNFTQFSC